MKQTVFQPLILKVNRNTEVLVKFLKMVTPEYPQRSENMTVLQK